jgi:methylsterol monooxygenase
VCTIAPYSLHKLTDIVRNSTLTFSQAIPEYWAQFDQISATHVSLNFFEKLWAAWYAYMNNDILATGIMSFTMHEVVYFGRSLPWIIIDCLPFIFKKYKIQHNKIPTAWEQWQCALLVLLSHVTVELPQIWYITFSAL